MNAFYGDFGISIQNYFTLEDYIRSNIDNIYKAIIPVALSMIIGVAMSKDLQIELIENDILLVQIDNLKNDDQKKDIICQLTKEKDALIESTKRQSKYDKIFYYSSVLALLITTVFFYYKKFPRYLDFAYFSFLLMWPPLIHKLLPKHVFRAIAKKGIILYITLFTLFPFTIGSIYYHAKHESNIIKAGKGKIVRIIVENNGNISPVDNMTLLGTSSRYAFLYNNQDNTIKILPHQRIIEYTYKR